MKAFSLLLPTRERPMLLKRLLDSVGKTVSNPAALEVILYIDADDVESRKVSHPFLCVTRQIGPIPRKTMGSIIRDCYRASHGHYVMLMNDDVIFRTKGWDVKLLRALSQFPDEVALVYGKDLYYDEQMCTFPVLPRTTCDLMDGICPPDYDTHCIDSHIFDTFRRLAGLGHDRCVYLPNVVFEHMNYDLGTLAYEDGINHKNDQKDQAAYLSLDRQRQSIAQNLAQHIETHAADPAKATAGQADKETKIAAHVALWSNVNTSGKSLVSVIVPVNSGSWGYAEACLKGILAGNEDKTLSIEFIVVTNGEVEEAFDCPRKIRKKMTIISSERSDPAGVYNAGASVAKGDYLVFFDSSSFPQRGWLKALVEAAQNDEVGVVGSRWLNSRNGLVEHVGIGFHRDNGDLKSTHIYRGFAADHPAVNKVRELQAVRSIGMLVKKDVFLALGGYGEVPAGLEDVDLCVRVRRSGKKVVCVPQASIYCEYQEYSPTGAGPSKDAAAFLSKWADRIECDMDELLGEDGYELRWRKKSHYICPSEEKVEELTNTECNFERSRGLLEGSFELIKTVRGDKSDLGRVCRGLADVYFSTGSEEGIHKIHQTMQVCGLSEPVILAGYERLVRTDRRNMGTVESVDMYAGTRFVLPLPASVSQIQVKLYKKGTPGDDLVAYIYHDDEGPSTPVTKAASEPVGARNITSDPAGQWTDFAFAKPVSLSDNTHYWIVLHRTGPANNASYYRILLDSSSDCEYPYAADYYGAQPTGGNVTNRISQLFRVPGVVAPDMHGRKHCRKQSFLQTIGATK